MSLLHAVGRKQLLVDNESKLTSGARSPACTARVRRKARLHRGMHSGLADGAGLCIFLNGISFPASCAHLVRAKRGIVMVSLPSLRATALTAGMKHSSLTTLSRVHNQDLRRLDRDSQRTTLTTVRSGDKARPELHTTETQCSELTWHQTANFNKRITKAEPIGLLASTLLTRRATHLWLPWESSPYVCTGRGTITFELAAYRHRKPVL